MFLIFLLEYGLVVYQLVKIFLFRTIMLANYLYYLILKVIKV